MNQTNAMENKSVGSINVRQEVQEFIDSINFDLSNRIKTPLGSQVISEMERREKEPVLNFSNRKLLFRDEKYLNYYSKAQRWLGHVTEINGSVFKAKLQDLTNKGTWEFGEFEWEEVSEEDRPLIQIGSAFYWWIGFAHENGQISKTSLIRFQRVLRWDETYMNAAADRASRLAANLKWE